MNTVIVNDEFKIFQDKKNPTIYTILFSYSAEILIKSITKTKIILGSTITDNYQSLILNVTSIKTLKQYKECLKKEYRSANLSYESVLLMTYHLSSQLKYLIDTYNKSFIGYSPENIIVIDDNKFIYLSNDHLHSINIETEEITITCPFSQSDFIMSPEILLVKELPSNIHYKTAYYSLGYLITCCLIPDDIFDIDKEEEDKNILKILDSLSLKGTQLYFLLKRSLMNEARNRSLIFL